MAVLIKNKDYFITTNDVDSNDIIKPHAICGMFQDIAAMHADEMGIGYEDSAKLGLAWVILYTKIQILMPPKYFTNVTLSTWPKKPNKIEYDREYALYDENENLKAMGISNWISIDFNKRTINRKPIEFDGQYNQNEFYPYKSPRRLYLEDNLYDGTFEYVVMADDIDHNGHVNNCKYLSIIYNFLKPNLNNKFINYIEISYLLETNMDDIIKIKYYKREDSKYNFIGYVNETRCFEAIIGEKDL